MCSIAAGPSSLSRSDAAATFVPPRSMPTTVTAPLPARSWWMRSAGGLVQGSGARTPRFQTGAVRRQAPGGTWDRAALPVSRPRRAFRFPPGRDCSACHAASPPPAERSRTRTPPAASSSESEKPPPLETVRPTTPEPLRLTGSMAISTLPEEFVRAVPRSPARCVGDQRARPPLQARGEPAGEQQRARRAAGPVADRDRVSDVQRGEARRAGRSSRQAARATASFESTRGRRHRSSAASSSARASAAAGSGTSIGVQQHDVDRDRATRRPPPRALRRPQRGRQLGYRATGSTIVSSRRGARARCRSRPARGSVRGAGRSSS